MTDLPQTILKYVELIEESKSSQVSCWTVEFIQQCTDWCILIETELVVLDQQDRARCMEKVQDQLMSEMQVPTLEQLLDAKHHFYSMLLENKYISNKVYYYIISNYQFLTSPEKEDCLIKDLSSLASKSAAENILLDILNELNNA